MLLVRPPRQRLVVSIMYTLESVLQSKARIRLTVRREDLSFHAKEGRYNHIDSLVCSPDNRFR